MAGEYTWLDKVTRTRKPKAHKPCMCDDCNQPCNCEGCKALAEAQARIATLEREHAELLEVARPSGLIAQLQEEQGEHECPACSYRWIDPQNLKDHYQGEHA